MITLKQQKARIAHVNPRVEMHGEEEVLCVDVKVKVELASGKLEHFANGLAHALYRRAGEEPGDQQDIEAGHLSEVRFPFMSVKWAEEVQGCSFIIHGARKEDNVGFTARVHAWSFDCKEGGTVETIFKASGSNMESDDVGRLVAFLGHDAKVSLTLPASVDEALGTNK